MSRPKVKVAHFRFCRKRNSSEKGCETGLFQKERELVINQLRCIPTGSVRKHNTTASEAKTHAQNEFVSVKGKSLDDPCQSLHSTRNCWVADAAAAASATAHNIWQPPPLAQGERGLQTGTGQHEFTRTGLVLDASAEGFYDIGHQGTTASRTLTHLAGSTSCPLTLAT